MHCNSLIRSGSITGWFVTLAVTGTGFCQAEPGLFETLTTSGVEFAQPSTFSVPVPLLAERSAPELPTEVIERLSGGFGWQKFSRKSVFAPVHIDVNYLKDRDGERVGHHAYSAFIAYAALDRLRNRQLLESVFGNMESEVNDASASVEELDTQELMQTGRIAADDSQQHFAKIRLPLLKRVVVRGVIRLESSEGPDWFRLAWGLDPRFAASKPDSDKNLANTWTKIARDEVGQAYELEPQPYQGWAGYIHVAATGREAEQLLIESHMLLHEPQDWFAGSNALRAKLPLSMEEAARRFRRKLAKLP